jgi:hypothetical protein
VPWPLAPRVPMAIMTPGRRPAIDVFNDPPIEAGGLRRNQRLGEPGGEMVGCTHLRWTWFFVALGNVLR